jgi:membrane-associated phospholipid phosphatase
MWIQEVVLILLALVAVALVGGLLAAWAARRWPKVDPTRAVVAAAREGSKHHAPPSFLRARMDPGTATGLGLTLALVGVVAGGAILGVLALLVRASDTGLVALDRSAATWGAHNATTLSTTVLRVITQLGATVTITVLSIAVAAFEYRRAPSRSVPGYLALAVIGQMAIVNLIKLVIARARPDIDPLAGFTGASFPSGHTTAAASFYAAAALMLGRGRSLRVRSILAGVAVAVALAVGASRVLLGVHWLTDVLAGLALGWSWFAICGVAFGGRMMRFAAPVEAAQVAAETESAPSGVKAAVSEPGSAGYRSSEERNV